MKKVLFTAQDPSSGNIVSALVKKLAGVGFQILGSGESKKIFSRQGIKFIDVDSGFNLEVFFNVFQPNLVITGASVGDTIDRKGVLLAREKSIISVSILDFWVNYVERYSNLDTGEKLVFLPNYVFVPDELAKKDMTALGFPEEILKPTGNPHFDAFIPSTQKGNGILYISQTRPNLETDHVEFVFEPSVLNDLLEFFDNMNDKEQGENKEKIVVRLHPKDNLEDFKEYFKGRENVILDQDSDLDNLIDNSHIVIGISSVVLLQAALKEKLIISYRPDIGSPSDTFICKRLGGCYSAYNKNEFFELLQSAVGGRLKPLSFNKKLDRSSTERVLKEVHLILGK